MTPPQSKIDCDAVILAGGFGTRLKDVVKDIPKPMADVNGKPFLEYILQYLKNFGIRNVVLSVGYKHEVIRSAFGSRYDGVKIDYAVEKNPLGTGGGVKLASALVGSEHLILMNGDTFFDVDLEKMCEFHKSRKADITVAIKQMYDFDRYGVVEFDSQSKKISVFKEKSYKEKGFINGGVYILRKNIFLRADLPEKFSLEKDILEKSLKTKSVLAFDGSMDRYFIDIGIPEDYEKAQNELEKFGD